MALIIPSYPNPYSVTPVVDAYAWTATLFNDFRPINPADWIACTTLMVHPSAEDAAAGKPPIDSRLIYFGGPEGLPSLGYLLATDPEVAAAYGVIKAKQYELLAALPEFEGSQVVE